MFKTIALTVALLCCVSAFTIEQPDVSVQAVPWPYTECGKGGWKITSLTLNAAPKRDTTNDIDVLGKATEDTSFTQVVLNVKLNGAPLHSETIDFKQSYQEEDTVEFKYKNFVPGFAPSGTYSLTFNFKNGSKDNGCLAFSFKL